MPHLRYKTLDEFRAVIEPFDYDAYMNRPYEPFVELMAASAIEVPYYSYAQFHKYAAILIECAKEKGVDGEHVHKKSTISIAHSLYMMICGIGFACISSR